VVTLINLNALKPHEGIEQGRLNALIEKIRSEGVLKLSIAVDVHTKIIIDGHHRVSALKELSCTRIPVTFVDYRLPEIEVTTWRDDGVLSKNDVITAGLGTTKLPPRTSRHIVNLKGEWKHISAIEERINISLEELRK
jgi:hypothetical protein